MKRGLQCHDSRLRLPFAAADAVARPPVATRHPSSPRRRVVNALAGSCRCFRPCAKEHDRPHDERPTVRRLPTDPSVPHCLRDAVMVMAMLVQPAPRLAQQRARHRPFRAAVATQAVPVVFQLEFGVQVERAGMPSVRRGRECIGTAGILPGDIRMQAPPVSTRLSHERAAGKLGRVARSSEAAMASVSRTPAMADQIAISRTCMSGRE